MSSGEFYIEVTDETGKIHQYHTLEGEVIAHMDTQLYGREQLIITEFGVESGYLALNNKLVRKEKR